MITCVAEIELFMYEPQGTLDVVLVVLFRAQDPTTNFCHKAN